MDNPNNKAGIIVIGIVFILISLVPWGMFVYNLMAFIHNGHAVNFLWFLSPLAFAVVADLIAVLLIVNAGKIKDEYNKFVEKNVKETEKAEEALKNEDGKEPETIFDALQNFVNKANEKTKKCCPYCNSKINKNEDECPNYGAHC